jgi:hypothetical protein
MTFDFIFDSLKLCFAHNAADFDWGTSIYCRVLRTSFAASFPNPSLTLWTDTLLEWVILWNVVNKHFCLYYNHVHQFLSLYILTFDFRYIRVNFHFFKKTVLVFWYILCGNKLNYGSQAHIYIYIFIDWHIKLIHIYEIHIMFGFMYTMSSMFLTVICETH